MKKDLYNRNLVAYIAGELADLKRVEMENEIKKDKDMQEQIDDYSKLWNKSSELSQYDKIDVENDWKSVRTRMGFETKSKRIPLKKYFLRISAILVLAFGLAWFLNQLINQFPEAGKTDYFKAVASNEIKEVILPDGSVVTLNKGASLFYNNNFNTENRDLILEGEAFFEVSRNESLPFKVFVSNSTIEVLGTSFNIKTDEERVQLSVVTGHVAFFETSNKNNRVDLQKNEMTQYFTSKQKFDNKMELNVNTIAWKTGKLEFKNVPMNEVFSTLANYYGLELVMNVENGFSESFTASFNKQPIEEILEMIEISTRQEFVCSIKNNKLVVSE
jgi:transmembrane sensor